MHPVDRLRDSRLLPVLVLLAWIALVLFISMVSGVLAPFLWAMMTAYVLFPIVAKLERTLRLPRIVVVAGLYAVFIAVLAGLVVYLGPSAVSQARELVDALPSSVQNAREELIRGETVQIGGFEFDTRELNARIDEVVQDAVLRLGDRAVPLVLHTVELAIQILVYFLVTFYFLLHGDKILLKLRYLAPRRYQNTISRVGGQVNATLGAYIRGQVILFFIMSAATFIALTILDVEYALVLAIATGVLELVPIIGPWIAGSAAVTVALSQGHAPFGWTQIELAIAVALTYFALRMLEDHFVIPQLIGRIVKVHPVLVIFAVLAGADVFGMLGLLLAVPLTATLKIIVQAIYYELGNPPERLVFAVKSAEDLENVRNALTDQSKARFVLLIGPNSISWDELPRMQELARLAVEYDFLVEVVTPDPFAASIATAAGLQVITQARLSDEVAVADAMSSEPADLQPRERYAYRAGESSSADQSSAVSQPAVGDTIND